MRAALRTTRAVIGRPVLRRLVGAFLAFSVTEWASWIAIVTFAFTRGGPAEAGLIACVVFVPSILVAPAASIVGDRRPRAWMLLAAYLSEALAMGLTALAMAFGPALLAYAAATLAATSITLARPAHAALLPEIVETPDELAIANAASGTVEGLGALLGPLVTGLLVALGGPAAVYLAASVLATGSTLAVLPIARHAPPRPLHIDEAHRTVLGLLGAGFHAVLADRRLTAVFAILAGVIALLGAFNVLVAIIATELLGGDDSTIGFVAAISGLGAVIGAGATGILAGRDRLASAYVGAAIVFAVAVALIGLDPPGGIILVCVAAAGFGWAFVYVEALTLAQRLAGDDVMSRVFGVMESTMMASQALGALAVPILTAAFGTLAAIVASGVGLALVVLIAGPTLIRADRVVPDHARKLRAMRAIPMFGPLSAPVLERLVHGAHVEHAAAGQAIVTEGEVGDRFYVILEGAVEVTNHAGLHRRQAAGESFGEIALVRGVPRTATVSAIERTELLVLDRASFLEALTGQPRSRALADAESQRRLDRVATG
jgi:MFS family permease